MARAKDISFIRLPVELLHLGITSAAELVVVALAFAFKDKGLRMSNGQLASLLSMDRRHIPRLVQRLVRKGLLRSSTENGSRVLWFADTKVVSPPDTKMVTNRHQSGDKVTPKLPSPSKTEETEGTEYPPAAPSEEAGAGSLRPQASAKPEVLAVFECWNSHAGPSIDKTDSDTGQVVHIHWHSRKPRLDGTIPLDADTAIRAALKGFGGDDIRAAINNFAAVLLSTETFWTYAWSLSEFFTRREGRAKDSGYKWWRFLPDSFDFEKYRLRRKPNDGLNLDGSTEEEILAALGKQEAEC
jgi:hypothetical protein